MAALLDPLPQALARCLSPCATLHRQDLLVDALTSCSRTET
jgi:hypothetical protein